MGRTDEPLAPETRQTLLALSEEKKTWLKEQAGRTAALYMSPMRRCLETAELLFPKADYPGVPRNQVPDLLWIPGFFSAFATPPVFCKPKFTERDGFMQKKINVRTIAMTAVLGAVATALMMLSFSVPFMPSFIKLDFSELPALIAAFSMGQFVQFTVQAYC